jgi:Fibronectin type III domain
VAYDLYMDNGYNGDFSLIQSAPTTTYLVQYLTPGLMYRFRLRARSAVELESDLSTIQYMMAGTTPSAPGAPQLITQSNLQMEFYWNEPYDNGGTSITSYEVEITRVSDSNVQSITVINSNRYLYQSASLGFREGEEYHVRIRARNFISEYYSLFGTWSAVSTFYTSILP